MPAPHTPQLDAYLSRQDLLACPNHVLASPPWPQVNALRKALATRAAVTRHGDPSAAAAPPPVVLAAVKSLLGHTEGTAGLAGLMQAAAVLQAAATPPLRYRALNPAVGEVLAGDCQGRTVPGCGRLTRWLRFARGQQDVLTPDVRAPMTRRRRPQPATTHCSRARALRLGHVGLCGHDDLRPSAQPHGHCQLWHER